MINLLTGLLVTGLFIWQGGESLWAKSREPHSLQSESAPLFNNLGDFRYPVTTSGLRAQAYFDQGLILAFGFNHAEAARSFQEAQRQDPGCAMCFWGEALVLGPNINAPMDPFDVPRAIAAVRQAWSLSEGVTDKERALIRALEARYTPEVPDDRGSLDEAYAEAMRMVWQAYPDDTVIGALLAEALMDLHPWDFWSRNGEAKPWTAEIISLLERVIAQDAGNPLAHHLYIHVMEASPHPEKAIPSAEVLPGLVPGSGHLVHMPAHIWIRIGRYHDAALANQRAVDVDEQYLHHSHTESLYTAAYVPHNFHFLWAAAIKTGQSRLALQAARDAAAKVEPEGMRDPGMAGTLQHFWLLPLYTQALFGRWEEVMQVPEPPADLLYPRAIWLYSRGLALLRQEQIEEAVAQLEFLKRLKDHPAIASLTVFDLNGVPQLLRIAAGILAGEISAARGDYESAVKHLQEVVRIEDGLNYTEPKDWYLPPRQVLGAVLLEAGRPAEAEQVYREDLLWHPQNGWSLFGLVQSLKAQKKSAEKEAVQASFDDAWGEADVQLPGSRF
jgi:tetratricopeptide (TPR) repeat protein